MSKYLPKGFMEDSIKKKDIPCLDLNLFQVRSLKLEICDFVEVHNADKFESESYKTIHQRFTNCVSVPELIKILDFPRFFPIYFITTNNDIVYVGKNIDGPRFVNGHKATQKLNESIYNGTKIIHFAQIWVEYTNDPKEDDDDYDKYVHPLEWLKPKSLIKDIVDFIERALMVHLKNPKTLNISGVTRNQKMNLTNMSKVFPIGYPTGDDNKDNDQIVVTITDHCGSGLTKTDIKWKDIADVIQKWT